MMKKILCALLSAALLLTFAACSDDHGGETGTTPARQSEKSPAASTTAPAAEFDPTVRDDSVFSFPAEGVYITPNRPFAPVSEKLGAPRDSVKSMGCIFTDEEWEYYYSHFIVMTYRDQGVDYVGTVQFTDDAVATGEGLRIGMTEQEATAIYGSDCEAVGNTRVYTRGNTRLILEIRAGSVVNVSYSAIYE